MTVVGLMTIIGSIMVYFLRKAWPIQSAAQIIVGVSGGLAVIGFATSVYYLFRANLGFLWQVLPSPSACWTTPTVFESTSRNIQKLKGNPDKDFEDYLTAHLSRAATANGENNLQRSGVLLQDHITSRVGGGGSEPSPRWRQHTDT